MKFVVLNGSPKGNELSSTMHYLYYMQKKVTGHEYEIFSIAKDIKKIEITIKNRYILKTAVFKDSSCCVDVNKNGIVKIYSIKLCILHIYSIKNTFLEKSIQKWCLGKVTIINNAFIEKKGWCKKGGRGKICTHNYFTFKINHGWMGIAFEHFHFILIWSENSFFYRFCDFLFDQL